MGRMREQSESRRVKGDVPFKKLEEHGGRDLSSLRRGKEVRKKCQASEKGQASRLRSTQKAIQKDDAKERARVSNASGKRYAQSEKGKASAKRKLAKMRKDGTGPVRVREGCPNWYTTKNPRNLQRQKKTCPTHI